MLTHGRSNAAFPSWKHGSRAWKPFPFPGRWSTRRDMNFASDNIVGGSAPVLQAILDANAGTMTAYGNDEISKRGSGRASTRSSNARSPSSSSRPGRRPMRSPSRPPCRLRALRLSPGGPHHRRRVRRAGILHAWGEARRAARNRRQAEGRGHRRLSARPAQGGEADAAEARSRSRR